jgi:hypothetical protein
MGEEHEFYCGRLGAAIGVVRQHHPRSRHRRHVICWTIGSLRLVRIMDCAHARRIYPQERHGNGAQVCLVRRVRQLPNTPRYVIKRCGRSSVPAETKERNSHGDGKPECSLGHYM